MWFRGIRQRKAMLEADGIGPPDPARAGEVRMFRDLSRLVRDAAVSDPAAIPPFDECWSGVERRLQEPEPVAGTALDGLRAFLERRPVLVLAPLGAVVLAAVIGVLWWTRPVLPSNQCFVDSYDVESGTVLIDQDPDRPDRPTVIWHEADSRKEG